jgi:putative oxidoreductase
MGFGRLILRLTIGLLFIGHGTQKLFGWFGGPGLDGVASFFDSIGLRPPRRQALAAGLTETTGGSLLVLGAATPVAVAGLTGVMVTAVRKVHADKGVWNEQGGFEYNAVLVAALLGLVEAGPGPLSLDSALGARRPGSRWALAALAAGVVGSFGATTLARLAGEQQPRLDESADGKRDVPDVVVAAAEEPAG